MFKKLENIFLLMLEVKSEDAVNFGKFMQEKESLRFVKVFGFPEKLFSIHVNRVYGRFVGRGTQDISQRVFKKTVERRRDSFRDVSFKKRHYFLGDLDCNWVETDKNFCVDLFFGYGQSLSNHLLEILPCEKLVAEERVFDYVDFDFLMKNFPVYDSEGNCRYVANFGQREFGLKVPSLDLKESFDYLYTNNLK